MILALNIIEHLSLKDAKTLINRLLKKLKRRGILILQFPNMAVQTGIQTFYSDKIQFFSYTKASFLQLSKTLNTEFSEIAFFNASFIKNRVDRMIRFIISKIFRIILRINLLSEKGFGYINETLSPNLVVVFIK